MLERRIKEGKDHNDEDFVNEVTKQAFLAEVRICSVPSDWPGTAEEVYEDTTAFYTEVLATARELGIQDGESLDPAIKIVSERHSSEGEVS